MNMAIIEALKNLMRRVPAKAWFAVGGLLVGAFWLQQHDARIRQQAEVQQLRNQTSAEVAALRKQAEQDVKQANVENAKAIAKLEQRRQQVVQQNRTLAAQLARLREQAQIQAGEVATLPISQIVNRVTTQLGLKKEDVASGATSDIAKEATPHGGTKAQSKLQITNDELQNPAVTATAESHTSQGPRRVRHPAGATSAPGEGKKTPHPSRPSRDTLSSKKSRRQ